MLFLPLRELKNSFFALNGSLSLLFLLFTRLLYVGDERVGILIAAGMILLLISYLIFLVRQFLISRIFLFLSVVVCLSAVILSGRAGVSPDLPLAAQWLGGLSLLLGALLLGSCYGTMILGHWYLVTPSLPFRYLVNSSRFLVLTTLARGLILTATLILFFWFLGSEARSLTQHLISFDDLGLFFIMRVFWGILGPLVLSFMILETAKIRSNQAATGILYVACIFVFIGELFSDYLFHMGGFPA